MSVGISYLERISAGSIATTGERPAATLRLSPERVDRPWEQDIASPSVSTKRVAAAITSVFIKPKVGIEPVKLSGDPQADEMWLAYMGMEDPTPPSGVDADAYDIWAAYMEAEPMARSAKRTYGRPAPIRASVSNPTYIEALDEFNAVNRTNTELNIRQMMYGESPN